MKRQETEEIGNVLQNILKEDRFQKKLRETRLMEIWYEVVGDTVKRYTERLFVSREKLFVKITSPMLKSDLMMRRTSLMEELNEKMGVKVIEEIVLL